ncbi:MAG: DUF3368 domain-containing protein [Synergistaceae bacterium]|nr:DUF3368 domain-containing protein [Synergistaceae bacterium]MBQ9595238.1 DUF3368 domain-containing protein [Synergistaceae bacterium]
MIVVADTSPIISLLKINSLRLLHDLFGTIFIPEGVYNELVRNEDYKLEAELIINSDFIQHRQISNPQAVSILRQVAWLDEGESEAIILFSELNAELLLIDERQGREIAEQLQIPISGTIGVLLKALNKNLVTKQQVLEYLDIFQHENRRFSKKLIDLVKKRLDTQ